VRRTEILEGLRRLGWTVTESNVAFGWPDVLRDRYPEMPPALTEFLDGLDSCVSSDETTWFLTRADYESRIVAPFPWNAWERMSLEGVPPDIAADVTDFWDRHLPIVLSVAGDYSYLALEVIGPGFGAVVSGVSPDFEGTSVVAPSFDHLLDLMLDAIRAPVPARSLMLLLS
jgi:hypothetical protein